MMTRERKLLTIAWAAVLWLVWGLVFYMTGCAGTAHAPHPNAINDLDSRAADALLEAQVTLCGLTPAGATECNGGLNHDVQGIKDAKVKAAAIAALQKATATYNAAQAAYKTWHAEAQHTPAADAQLNGAITQLVADVASAVRAFGGGK